MGKFDFLRSTVNEQNKPLNVLVVLCVHRGVDPDTFDSLMTLAKCPNPNMVIRCKSGDALIDRSRSIVATQFLNSNDYDQLLFIDDDILFNPVDAANLCKVTAKNHLGIAGAPYVKKQAASTHYAIKTFEDEKYVFGNEGGIQECEQVSTGFMCIEKWVLQQMVDKLGDKMPYCQHGGMDFYPFFQPEPEKLENGQWRYNSEDWAFCSRHRSLGGKVYVDTKTRLGHAGRYVFTDSDILRPAKKGFHAIEYTETQDGLKIDERFPVRPLQRVTEGIAVPTKEK